MGDRFYSTVRFLGSHVFWCSSRAVCVGAETIPKDGPLIIASSHTSPFDVPLLIRHAPRALDFVSIVEVFRHAPVAWFYGSMNAFPLDRSRPDAKTVRTILDRLARRRAIAMFPEGGFRRGELSVATTGRIRPGVGRLAILANAPVIPAVVVNSVAYARPSAWAPLRRVRYAVAFGAPLPPSLGAESIDAAVGEAIRSLYHHTAPMLPEDCRRM